MSPPSVAYTRWDDIQADTVIDGIGFPTTANIGDGRIYSLEVARRLAAAAGPQLEAAGSVQRQPGHQSRRPASIIAAELGPLPNVADFSGPPRRRLSDGDSRDDLDLRLGGSGALCRPVRLGVGPVLGEAQGDYLDTALGAAPRARPASRVTLGVTNLIDEVGNRFALGSPFTLVQPRQITPLRPRIASGSAGSRLLAASKNSAANRCGLTQPRRPVPT